MFTRFVYVCQSASLSLAWNQRGSWWLSGVGKVFLISRVKLFSFLFSLPTFCDTWKSKLETLTRQKRLHIFHGSDGWMRMKLLINIR